MHFLSCAGELNHHGKFMCDSIYKILGENFIRITTQKVNQERVALGYEQKTLTTYNLERLDIDKNSIREIVSWCDVMDFGAAPEQYLREAIRQDKVVFIRIERLLKEGKWKLFVPHIFLKYYRKYIRYRNNPKVYFLCISAYAAADLKKIGIHGDRVLQWAYCPEFYEIESREFEKRQEQLQLLWCGRMIEWKHPEMALRIAAELKKQGCDFHLKMLGTGEKEKDIQKMIGQLGLKQEVELCGAIEAKQVRKYMEKADVFLATSDQNEGWGVVINEAMNSGCVVFATPEMGATRVLIEDGENGIYIYNEQDTANKIVRMNEEEMKRMKYNAYKTIQKYFTPEVYAKTFIDLAESALNGKKKQYRHLGERAKIN